MSKRVDPGLCADCLHSRRVKTETSTFYMCLRSAREPGFPKYPPLPVERCPGYESGADLEEP